MCPQIASIEEIKRLKGKKGLPAVKEIDNGMIRDFVEAIGDKNPLWAGMNSAAAVARESAVAPPEFLCSAMMSGSAVRPDVPMPSTSGVDGSGEWEFYGSIRAGDTITSVCEFADIYTREGKSGKMAFMVFETMHTNQNDDLVGKSRTTLIATGL